MGAPGLDHPVAKWRGALLISLERNAEAAPSGGEQLIIGEQRLEHIELQFEPIRFLGVDGEVHIRLRCFQRQLAYDRNDCGERLCAVREFKPRMERGQLDRNARRPAEALLRFCRDPIQRTTIGLGVTFGVRDASSPPRQACRSCG